MDNQLIVSDQIGLSKGLTLEDCEHDIELANHISELVHYVKGKRLAQIRNNAWYRRWYVSWEDYCHDRWGMTSGHADLLIKEAEVIENLKTSSPGGFLPQTDRQTRPLVRLSPEQQVEAWQEAVRTAPEGPAPGIRITQEKKISGRHVQETIDRLYPKDDKSGPIQEISLNHLTQTSFSYSALSPSFAPKKSLVKVEPEWSTSELERKELVLKGETVVANKKEDKALIQWAQENGLYVAIDRGSIWGNPFILPDDGTRREVVENYRWYYTKKPSLQNKIDTLKGKVLGCWCYPLSCHGDVLKEQIDDN
jgi:hypothetical protein